MFLLFAQDAASAASGMSGSRIAVWAAIAGMLLILINNNRRGCEPRKSYSAWQWAFFAFVMFVAGSIVVTILSRERSHIAEHPARLAQEMAERVRRDVEAKTEQIQVQNGAIAEMTMQQAWDQLHKPRIPLETQSGGMGLEGPGIDNTSSLNHSIERLERTAERIANVADQVADVGTIVGRAMIALNNSLASESTVANEAAVVDAKAVLVAAAPRAQVLTADGEAVDADVELAIETPPAANAPAWIDDPPKRVGNVWREVLITDEFATDEECRRHADALLMKATYDYIRQMAGYPGGPVDSRGTETWTSDSPVYRALTPLGVGIDYVRREIAKDEYQETVQRSFGPMKKTYTLVEFPPNVDQELRACWEEHLRRERFAAVGLGAGSVLALVGLAYGLLKVDTWTKGYYSKRLFLGVSAAIIVFGLLLLFFVVFGFFVGLFVG